MAAESLGSDSFGPMAIRRDLMILFSVAAALRLAAEPADAAAPLPSEQLQDYSANNLEHLLGPLNSGALPRAELMKLEIDYKARLAQADPRQRATLQAAIDVCAAFDRIMDAREKAVVEISAAQAKNLDSEGS